MENTGKEFMKETWGSSSDPTKMKKLQQSTIEIVMGRLPGFSWFLATDERRNCTRDKSTSSRLVQFPVLVSFV